MLVVDASVAIKWYMQEADSDLAFDLIANFGAAHAPSLVITELTNVIWVKRRSGSINEKQALEALGQLLNAFVFHDVGPLARSAYRLAVELQHPAYDCFYLALAEREGARLITADQRFCRLVRTVRPKAPIALLGEIIP